MIALETVEGGKKVVDWMLKHNVVKENDQIILLHVRETTPHPEHSILPYLQIFGWDHVYYFDDVGYLVVLNYSSTKLSDI